MAYVQCTVIRRSVCVVSLVRVNPSKRRTRGQHCVRKWLRDSGLPRSSKFGIWVTPARSRAGLRVARMGPRLGLRKRLALQGLQCVCCSITKAGRVAFPASRGGARGCIVCPTPRGRSRWSMSYLSLGPRARRLGVRFLLVQLGSVWLFRTGPQVALPGPWLLARRLGIQFQS